MTPRRVVLLVAALVALAATAGAGAFSQDDSTYYETFVDTSGLQLPLTNTALDAQGGLRLATNGAPSVTSWDTDTNFASGVTYQSQLFGPVGLSTLQTSGTGPAATLTLPATTFPLTPDAADPVLSPTASTVGDGDNVDDPTLAKVGSTYDMWYTGYAEDGSAPAIFLATSTDGLTWTRANAGAAVLQGTPGAFDANGVFGADVVYDPTDLVAPYKMWYSGQAGVFGGIGYATSTDGITWTKYTNGGPLPVPVLNHGPAGSADSFMASDPSVLKDGSTWKMWYTGDDSSKKRIAYATSQDGVSWTKGGKVLSPEDPGASANIAFGAFSPTVWKTNTGFSMILAGRKIVSGNTFQIKLLESTSTDGLTWTSPSPVLNAAGPNNFDDSNLGSPDVLYDPAAAKPYLLFYSGNTIDANGNFHTRIGLATSSDGNSFSRVTGPMTGSSVLDIGTAGTTFDARQASGVSATEPGGTDPNSKFVGFYWGTRGSDFMPRLGEATSPDGSTWTKVAGAATGGAILALPGGSKFNSGGERDPGVLFDSGTYDLYFTGLSSSGSESIGFTSTAALAGTNVPDNSTWATPTQVLTPGGASYDSSGVSHPSVIKDGATYDMYFTGDSSGTLSIGRATAASAGGPFVVGANAVLTPTAGTFDEAGVKDPVVFEVGAGDYRMLYTGIDNDGIERVGYATSTDGLAWTKQGLVLDPSLTPFAADEVGVEPTGMCVDGTTVHVWTSGIDRTGRTRGEHATTTLGVSGTTPSGWATYQLGDSTTTIEDFRQIARTSTGDVTLYISFLQPYSSAGNEFWSNYFPVTLASPSEALNFLLTVHGIRWRAQLSDPTTTPSLDNVQLTEAPVSLATSGSAATNPIQAAPGRLITAWSSLAVDTSILSPTGSGTGGGTVSVVDSTTSAQLATSALNTAGQTTIDLSAVSAVAHPSIEVVFSLTGSGNATPLVQSFTLTYTSQPAPITVTIAAAPKKVVYGSRVTLSGVLAQGTLALSGQTVTLAAKPFGGATFTPFATPTTDPNGAYSVVVKPTTQTVYQASAAGVTTLPIVTVKVSQLLKLSARRKGGRVYFKGSLGPRKKGRVVLIQKLAGRRWKTIARVKTTSRSTFAKVLALAPARHGYRFRATTKAYTGLLAGTSRTVKLRK